MNQLKLTDVINPQSQKQQGKGLKHILLNSLRRNIISHSQQKNIVHQYEVKLNSHNFSSHDMHLLFMHLYSKEEMSLSDRNLVRRLLLIIFPQPLIYAGGKTLIHNIRYVYYEKGQNIINQKQFFLILKGVVQIKSPYYERQAKAGTYFGHLQLLGKYGTEDMQIVCNGKCSLLVIQQCAFHNLYRHYFEKLNEEKMKAIPPFLTKQLNEFQLTQICEEMVKVSLPVAAKIFTKGQCLENLVFVSSGKVNTEEVNHKYSESYGKVIGFLQYIKEKQVYDQNYFALEQIVGYSIPLTTYKKIVLSQRFSSLFESISRDLSMVRSDSLLKVEQQNKKVRSNKNFLRVRKVKLPVKGRFKTSTSKMQPETALQSDASTSFFFIKSQNKKVKYGTNKTSFIPERVGLNQNQIEYIKSNMSYFN